VTTRSEIELKLERDTLADKRSRLMAEIAALEDAHAYTVENGRMVMGPEWSPGERERLDNLKRGAARLDERDSTLFEEYRSARLPAIEAAFANSTNSIPAWEAPRGSKMTSEYDDDPTGARRAGFAHQEPVWERTARTDAFRTIERHRELTPRAADRLDELVRRPGAHEEAAYLAAVGAPGYLRAFLKAVADPNTGHMRWTPTERAAWDGVNEAVARGTALGISTGSIGGFALPFELDPTIVDTGAGTICPLRSLATVRTLTQNEWHGVTSDAVVAQYQAEAAAVPEAGPTLAQPILKAHRGSAFISASIELLQDDPGIVNELAVMMASGRDRLDATKFLIGSGTNEPLGIMVPGTAGSLTTTQRVQTAVADTVSAVDLYSLSNAIDPAARANLDYVMSPTTAAYIYRLTPPTSSTEPVLIPTFGGPLLGGPVHPWSTMSDAVTVSTTGDKIVIGGDFKQAVLIGDRLGTTVEVIPHLFGPAQGNLPTGQRGLVMWWRSGCVVRNPNMLRYLEVR
jgi:HK97 family phage major capsid protein